MIYSEIMLTNLNTKFEKCEHFKDLLLKNSLETSRKLDPR